MRDFVVLAAVGVGAIVGYEMWKKSRTKENPDDEMEKHLTDRLAEKINALNGSSSGASLQSSTPDHSRIDSMERKLKHLERELMRRNPRHHEREDEYEYDDVD